MKHILILPGVRKTHKTWFTSHQKITNHPNHLKLWVMATIVCSGLVFGISDSYATDINCNQQARSINEAICLQDMNNLVKYTMVVNQTYELVDSRDGNVYRIAKLADNNVWFLDNLRLGGVESISLTSNDTNTDPDMNNGEFQLPASGSWEDTYTMPQINTSEVDNTLGTTDNRKIGGYYNYCAASAGTYCSEQNEGIGDAEFDICPANWRMPIGGNGGEYQVVDDLYSNLSDTLLLPLSGRFYTGASGHLDQDGYFWSSTNRDGLRMYYLNRTNNQISATGSYRRDRGYSMRCVAKDVTPAIPCNQDASNISEAVCLGDINTRVKESMVQDKEYTLLDSRDGEIYNIAKLADGNVWLLDNLRLGGSEELLLTSQDTNTNPAVNNGEFTLPASSNWENSYTAPMISQSEATNIADDENNWLTGGYYNYCAASAGTYCDEQDEATGDAEYDICPADWRMPTGGNGGEYQALSEMTDIISALHLPLSGRFYNGASGYQGQDGYFWSSTNRDGARMYYLNREGDSINPLGSYRRDRGYSMRCLLSIKENGTGNYTWRDNIDTYTKSSGQTLVLEIDKSNKALSSVNVDGAIIDADNYEAQPDGAIVLKIGFLETLGIGEHSITVIYASGDEITATFNVAEQPSGDDVVPTPTPTPDSTPDTTPIPVPNTGTATRDTESNGGNTMSFAIGGIIIATLLLPIAFLPFRR